MGLIRLLIVSRQEALDPGMPSHFFPGAGSDSALFQVLGSVMPTELELTVALSRWCPWSSLANYRPSSGVGQFHVVDDEAPAAGDILELEVQDADRVTRVTIVIERG